MRTLKRNETKIYYKNFVSSTANTDSDGLMDGTYAVTYGDLKSLDCHVAPPTGLAAQSMFGIDISYSRVIITGDINCDLDEHSIVWLEADTKDPHNYIVARKAKSLNYVAFALAEVDHGS